uniref:Uncharacterized protein n=1 Tax=Anopheles dirus TaxID=7168 RepID=A0A182NDD1_9DIPT
MARFTVLAALFVGLVCLMGHARAFPGAIQAPGDASQIPNFPGPGDIPKPPGMLHNRRSRRNARQMIDLTNLLPALQTTSYTTGDREKRAAKGTGGKLPRKAG